MRDLLQQIVKKTLYDGKNVKIELRVPKAIRDELNSKDKLKNIAWSHLSDSNR